MGTVNDIVGTIGGVIMVLELIVLLLLLIGINVVLALALRWVRHRRSWVSEKRSFGQSMLVRYVERAVDIAAAPVIISSSVWTGLKAGLHRATHWERLPAPEHVGAPRLTAGENKPRRVSSGDPSQAA